MPLASGWSSALRILRVGLGEGCLQLEPLVRAGFAIDSKTNPISKLQTTLLLTLIPGPIAWPVVDEADGRGGGSAGLIAPGACVAQMSHRFVPG